MSDAPFVLRDPVPRETTIRDPRALMMIELGKKLQRGEKLTLFEQALTNSEEYTTALRREAQRIENEKKTILSDLERQSVELERQRNRTREALEAYKSFCAAPFKLERPQGTVRHQLFEAIARHCVSKSSSMLDVEDIPASDAPLFLVEHNWAAALSGATDFAEGEFKLPFENTWFEFRISGVPILLYYREDRNYSTGFLRAATEWVSFDLDAKVGETGRLAELVTAQVRAVCVALDADVAVKEVVRSPAALNRSREKRGREPVSDYHVVRLARRERPALLPDGHQTSPGTRHRLHFVRGHWRHYATHKTWIKWHLRGDPDLGFIDKHYRL